MAALELGRNPYVRPTGCTSLYRDRGQKEATMQSDPERRARGAQKIGEILGQTPEQVERSLGDVAPQLATYVLETIYGEIYQSPRWTRAPGRSSPSRHWRRSEPRRRNCEPILGARCAAALRVRSWSRS